MVPFFDVCSLRLIRTANKINSPRSINAKTKFTCIKKRDNRKHRRTFLPVNRTRGEEAYHVGRAYFEFFHRVTRFSANTHPRPQLPSIWAGQRLQTARLHNLTEIIKLILRCQDERSYFQSIISQFRVTGEYMLKRWCFYRKSTNSYFDIWFRNYIVDTLQFPSTFIRFNR